MKKALISIVILAIAVILVGAFLTSRRHTQSGATGNSNSTNTSSNSTQNSSSTSQSAHAVTISNFSFSPATLTVKKGTTVTWTNQDSVAHTVTETDGKTGPDSASLGKGQTYSFTYTTAGTFTYHCKIHPDMTGTVTVTQ